MQLRPSRVYGRGLRAGTLGAWVPETWFLHCEPAAFPLVVSTQRAERSRVLLFDPGGQSSLQGLILRVLGVRWDGHNYIPGPWAPQLEGCLGSSSILSPGLGGPEESNERVLVSTRAFGPSVF